MGVLKKASKQIDEYADALDELTNKLKILSFTLEQTEKEDVRAAVDATPTDEDPQFGFPMTKEQWEKTEAWIKSHNETYHHGRPMGASGGRYEYIFTNTSIGVFGKCRCRQCKDAEFNFQEFW